MPLTLKPSNILKQHPLLILLLSAIFLLQSCSESGKPPKKKRHARTHLVTVFTVQPKPIILNTTRTGTIGIKRSVKLFSQEEGEIVMLKVDRGDVIKKSSLLVKIDDALIVALLAKATATREQARQNLVRNQRLSRKQLVSADQLIKAQTTYKIATADEKLLKIRVRNTRITAPFSGIISDRMAEQGDVVAKHRHVLTLIDPATYIINVKISELLIPHYKINDTVSIQIDALGSSKIKGKIVRIHPTIDPATRQGTIEIKMDTTPAGTKAGQLSRVTLTSNSRSGLSIPFNSLRRDKDGEFVFIVAKRKAKKSKTSRQGTPHNNPSTKADQQTSTANKQSHDKKPRPKTPGLTVVRHAVRSGLRHGTLVEIPDGLTANMKVINRGFLGLRPGKAIRIVDQVLQNKPMQPGSKKSPAQSTRAQH